VEISFASGRLRDLCNDSNALRRKYGADGAKLIRRRLDELLAATTLRTMRTLPAARCHELTGNLAGKLAVDAHKGFRLIFRPAAEPVPTKDDGGLDWERTTSIVVEEIDDYHHG
jgi:proteic killer suppression protein